MLAFDIYHVVEHRAVKIPAHMDMSLQSCPWCGLPSAIPQCEMLLVVGAFFSVQVPLLCKLLNTGPSKKQSICDLAFVQIKRVEFFFVWIISFEAKAQHVQTRKSKRRKQKEKAKDVSLCQGTVNSNARQGYISQHNDMSRKTRPKATTINSMLRLAWQVC